MIVAIRAISPANTTPSHAISTIDASCSNRAVRRWAECRPPIPSHRGIPATQHTRSQHERSEELAISDTFRTWGVVKRIADPTTAMSTIADIVVV